MRLLEGTPFVTQRTESRHTQICIRTYKACSSTSRVVYNQVITIIHVTKRRNSNSRQTAPALNLKQRKLHQGCINSRQKYRHSTERYFFNQTSHPTYCTIRPQHDQARKTTRHLGNALACTRTTRIKRVRILRNQQNNADKHQLIQSPEKSLNKHNISRIGKYSEEARGTKRRKTRVEKTSIISYAIPSRLGAPRVPSSRPRAETKQHYRSTILPHLKNLLKTLKSNNTLSREYSRRSSHVRNTRKDSTPPYRETPPLWGI